MGARSSLRRGRSRRASRESRSGPSRRLRNEQHHGHSPPVVRRGNLKSTRTTSPRFVRSPTPPHRSLTISTPLIPQSITAHGMCTSFPTSEISRRSSRRANEPQQKQRPSRSGPVSCLVSLYANCAPGISAFPMLPSCSTSHAVASVSSTADADPQPEHIDRLDCDPLARGQGGGGPLSAAPRALPSTAHLRGGIGR